MTDLPIFRKQQYPSCIVVAGRRIVKGLCRSHWHDCCEVELILSGSGTHIVNGKKYPVGAGSFHLLTTFDYHEYIADTPMYILCIMFDENIVDKNVFEQILYLSLTNEILSVTLSYDSFANVQCFFEMVIREEEKLSGSPCEMIVVDDRIESGENSDVVQYPALADDMNFSHSYISKIISCILLEMIRPMGNGIHSYAKSPVSDAILYLYKHYTEPITLTSVAESLNLHKSYLSRIFHQMSGHTFKQTLSDLRLRYACRMLVNTNQAVMDICYACGFESYTNFVRAFRERYQTTPLKYRQFFGK